MLQFCALVSRELSDSAIAPNTGCYARKTNSVAIKNGIQVGSLPMRCEKFNEKSIFLLEI